MIRAKEIHLNNKDQAAIGEFQEKVSQLLGNDLIRLALFGSKAIGTDTPDSDIDILILINDSAMTSKERILDAAFEVNLKYGVYISPRIIDRSTFNNPVWSQTPFIRSLRDRALPL